MADDEDDQVEAVEELLEEVVRALGLDADDRGDARTTRRSRGRSTARISGCSSAATARRSTPCSTLRSGWRARAAATGRRIVIDAEGYRERRETMLQRQADHAAADALRYGRAVALDAMTASERRLVHEYLRDHGEVQTYSEGDEPDRRLVVAPLDSTSAAFHVFLPGVTIRGC